MASFKLSMFSTSLPPSPLPTTEEFNLYHSIDRELYKILIFKLGRYAVESMNIMAFWMWLEQQNTGGMKLVKRMLSLPSDLINDLADESVTCLKCVEKLHFSYPESSYKLNLLPVMLGKDFSLRFLYEQRIMVLRGVRQIFCEVCLRAFKDINQDAVNKRSLSGQGLDINRRATFGGVDDDQEGSVLFSSVNPPFHAAEELKFISVLERQTMQQRQLENDELSDIFSGNINLQEADVFPDDRTIVLTISNTYPTISEAELWDFFTRTFGDFIEEIQVQPVLPGEEVLYVRMVTRMASIVDAVVKGDKAKYNINGKHVYAKKFVKANQP